MTTSSNGFTVHKRSDWLTVVIGISMAIVAEAIGVHLLLRHWSATVAWTMTLLDAYGIWWLVRDYRDLGRHVTTIEHGVLHLRYGTRWSVDVPLSNIACVKPITGEWKRKGVLKVAMMDDPKLMIELREPQIANGLMGIKRQIDAIAILPDEPERFAATLERCRASTS